MLQISWTARGGKAQHPADRRWPQGVDLDISNGAAASCTTTLPYPAPCIGTHLVRCSECGATAAVTAAGRADDPRTLRVPCERDSAPAATAGQPGPPKPIGRLL